MQFGTSCQNLYEQNTSSDYTTLLNKISLPEYHTLLENWFDWAVNQPYTSVSTSP